MCRATLRQYSRTRPQNYRKCNIKSTMAVLTHKIKNAYQIKKQLDRSITKLCCRDKNIYILCLWWNRKSRREEWATFLFKKVYGIYWRNNKDVGKLLCKIVWYRAKHRRNTHSHSWKCSLKRATRTTRGNLNCGSLLENT